MKKMFKIALCAMLTLALVLSFAACNNDAKESEVKEEPKNDVVAEETAKDFMDALNEFDVDKMADCCADPDAFKDMLGFDDVKDAVFEGMAEAGVDGEMAEMMAPFADGVIDIMKNRIDYEVVSVKEDGDDYIVTVEYSVPDFGVAGETLNTAFSEEESAALGEEIAQELVENGTITQTSTQEEIMDALINSMIDKLLPIMEEAIENAEIVTEKAEIKVVEKDGKWFVDEGSVEFAKKILE